MQSKLLFALLCFVTFFNLFFFRSIGSFGIQLFLIGAWTFLVGLGYLKGLLGKRKEFVFASGATLFLFTLFTLLRANTTVVSLLHLGSVFISIFTLYVFIALHPHLLALMEMISVPFLVLKNYLWAALQLLDGKYKSASPFSSLPSEKRSVAESNALFQKIRPVVVGLLIGAPITFLLISLFAKADPVFESVVRNIVGQKFLENMILRAVLSVIIFSIGLPVLLMKRTQTFTNPLNRTARWGLITEYSIVMALVAATIGLFVAIQWRYVFIPSVSGINLAQYGIKTYSEYVNRGFNELIIATLFIFSLIWFGLILMRSKPNKEVAILKGLQFTVLFEFVFVIFSVFRRIFLYQEYHGMSLVRFYGGYFVVFLFFLTCTLFLRHLYRFRFALVEMIGLIIAIAGLSLINIESYIAINHPPTVNDRVDYIYLSRLSPDGYEGWLKSFNWSKQVLTKEYPNDATISAEQRREIAYAGIALEQIIARNHDLMILEGSNEEVKQYYLALHQDSLKNIDESWKNLDLLEPGILVQEQIGDVQPMKTLRTHRDKLSQTRTALQTNLERLHANDFTTISPSLMYPNAAVSTYSNGTDMINKVSFNDVDCSYWGICNSSSHFNWNDTPDSFFTVLVQTDEQRKLRKVPLDSFLSWNPTRQLTFQSIQKDIPLSELIALQKRYFQLYRKISKQEVSEQDYDADISFNTPFLTPLYSTTAF